MASIQAPALKEPELASLVELRRVVFLCSQRPPTKSLRPQSDFYETCRLPCALRLSKSQLFGSSLSRQYIRSTNFSISILDIASNSTPLRLF